ncbi:MAG: hypothetical protein ACOY3K_03755 [Candidatus Omnitrophota bacterium]
MTSPKNNRVFGRKRIRRVSFVAAAFLLLCVFSMPAWANVLGNANFEEPIGNGTASNWNSSAGVSAPTRTSAAGDVYEGEFALNLNSVTGPYTWQLYDQVKPGDRVTMRAYGKRDAGVITGNVQIEFKKKSADGASDSLLVSYEDPTPIGAGAAFTLSEISAIAPPDTNRVIFTLETAGAGDFIFDSVVGEINPAKLNFTASKNTVEAGEPVLIAARFRNDAGTSFNDVKLVVDVPEGFSVNHNTVQVDGKKTEVRNGSILVSVGTLAENQTVTVGFIAVPSSAIGVGKSYSFYAQVQDGAGALNERAHLQIGVRADPLFNEGTIIGKVFNDLNQNTVQDEGEKGVPFVRLITEQGIIVVTDEYGRYHIPGVMPGRHLVKIDAHTLPEGTAFISEESFLVKITDGIMGKANFAVLLPPSDVPAEYQKDLTVMVTQGVDLAKPRLEVQIDQEILKTGLGVLEKDPVFTFSTNYPDFIARWYLEVRDDMGREVWTGYGIGQLPSEVPWGGISETGKLVAPGIYSYQLKVEDARGQQDWTPLKFLRVISKQDSSAREHMQVEIPPIGDFNLFKDGQQSIPLVAKPTIRVMGNTSAKNAVKVNGYPVPVDPETGRFQTEFYTQPGDRDIIVTTTDPEGESTSYHKQITVKDSMFFMVALGEEQLGINMAKGALNVVGQDEQYRDGFYQDGKMAYHLIGKVKGKFLVRSHLDTGDERPGLFTNMDPDDYYPVYGDGSVRDYEGQDTQGRLFLVVEFDRSYVKWGSYETDFNDTELSSFERTLSGFKFNYESLKRTIYGDPKSGVKGFIAEAQYRPEHNEFAATGGTLYYLRRQNVLEGSEKIRVEIRDKIQDIQLDSYELKEGIDYEIDYDQGRILLSKPLSSVAASDHLVSLDILDGNPVYLVVDYEYDAGFNENANGNAGVRAFTHLGDHVKLGVTGVEEKRPEGDYDLRGVDATFKFGRRTKIVTEYAETMLRQTNQSVSYNGGLSFADLGSVRGMNTRPRENAYLVKGESTPTDHLDVSAYLQAVEPGFSTARIRSQEGTKKYGLALRYKLTRDWDVRYRWDHNELADQLLPVAQNSIRSSYEKLRSQLFQTTYDDGKYVAQAEYRYNFTDNPETLNNLTADLISEFPNRGLIGAKVGYRVNDRLLPYIRAQASIQGDENRSQPNNQFGGGIRYEVTKNVYAYIEQMIGNIGDSTNFGIEQYQDNGARHYANLRSRDRGIGSRTLATAVGSSMPLGTNSRFYSERETSTFSSEEGYADILGYTGKIHQRWDYHIKYERRHLKNAATRLMDVSAADSLIRANSFSSVSGSLAYQDGKRLKARIYLEGRQDTDVPNLWQIVQRYFLDYKITRDWSFLGNYNYGTSRFTDPDDLTADFTEFNVGFAYRPVDHDRFNWLARYTYLRDIANDAQLLEGIDIDHIAHILATDYVFELNRYLGFVQKLAYKNSLLETSIADDGRLHSFLWANRVNFHVTRKWDLALEYRTLYQMGLADAIESGALMEVDREIYDYVRLGAGYNFSDLDDDLRSDNDFTSHGPFVRMTGKF